MGRNGLEGAWSAELGQAVRDAAPELPALTARESEELWQRIVTTTTAPPRSRSRWKAVVASLIAVGSIGVAGAATAGVFSAHTGRGAIDSEDAELGGPGERLDPAAPDFAAVLDEVTSDITFPTTGDRQRSLSWWVADLRADATADDESAIVSVGALRLWVSGNALCSWTNTWAAARRDRDAAAAERAADVILGSRTWPAISDTDPDLADDSEFAWLPDLTRAVRGDAPAQAQSVLETSSACRPGLSSRSGSGTPW